MTNVIESPNYENDAARLDNTLEIVEMYQSLPADVQDKLANGERLDGFMNVANAEWKRRNDARPAQGLAPWPAPQYLGTIERALRMVARRAQERRNG
jgi:hypothetical protein